ncbi:MAG TPA: tyrosine-type recombinase/integrase [Dissulfurispiraceae bacterium]|nr:tyrosine-type recombinase/integrase [Dissulfurispiraceae bacterium]
MKSEVCPKCRSARCFISVYWKGQRYKFRRDKEGFVYYYDRASRVLTSMRNAIDEGTFDPLDYHHGHIKMRSVANQYTLWLDQREQDVKAGELAISTYRHYRAYFSQYIKAVLGDIDCKSLDYDKLEKFKNALAGQSIKIKTRRNIMNALHAFLVWTWKQGVILAVPPFPSIDGDDATPRIALEYAEQSAFLELLPEQHRDIYTFGFETGLRPGELCALKIRDISLGGIATIQRTISCGVVRETTKAKNKMPIPLSSTAMDIARRRAEGRFADDFLFLNPSTKKRYSTEFLRVQWRKVTAKVTLYEAMRHSFCTQILDGGAELSQAQILLRHQSIKSTQAYNHRSVAKLSNIVENRGKVIRLKTGTKPEQTDQK